MCKSNLDVCDTFIFHARILQYEILLSRYYFRFLVGTLEQYYICVCIFIESPLSHPVYWSLNMKCQISRRPVFVLCSTYVFSLLSLYSFNILYLFFIYYIKFDQSMVFLLIIHMLMVAQGFAKPPS